MNTKHKLVFFGTSSVGLPFLERLVEEFSIPLIVTQPDSLGGRNRKTVIIPPVKTFGLEHNIEVIQPDSLSGDELPGQLKQIDPIIGVVISYGQFIPRKVFEVPRFRLVNVHFSLLPSYRGAAPVQRVIENGDTVSGITIFEIVKKMDAGPVWAQKQIEILPNDTTETLWDRMSREGAPFLIDTLHAIFETRISQIPQDHSIATYAPAVRKEEGKIDWNLTASQIFNKFRAFTPWPGITCCTGDKGFKLTRIAVSDSTHDVKPGNVILCDKQSMKVACGNGSVLEVIELQAPGKCGMTPYCYCRGNELPNCFN